MGSWTLWCLCCGCDRLCVSPAYVLSLYPTSGVVPVPTPPPVPIICSNGPVSAISVPLVRPRGRYSVVGSGLDRPCSGAWSMEHWMMSCISTCLHTYTLDTNGDIGDLLTSAKAWTHHVCWVLESATSLLSAHRIANMERACRACACTTRIDLAKAHSRDWALDIEKSSAPRSRPHCRHLPASPASLRYWRYNAILRVSRMAELAEVASLTSECAQYVLVIQENDGNTRERWVRSAKHVPRSNCGSGISLHCPSLVDAHLFDHLGKLQGKGFWWAPSLPVYAGEILASKVQLRLQI